jgi:hypothetical protein
MGRRAHSLIEQTLRRFARVYYDAPGAATLARLAATARDVDADALDTLRDHMLRLGVGVVSAALTVRAFDLVHGLATYDNAAAFTASFNRDLAHYADDIAATDMIAREVARRQQVGVA